MLSPNTSPTTLRALNSEVRKAKAILPEDQHQWADRYYGNAWNDVMLSNADESYVVKDAWASIENLIKKHGK